MTKLDELSAALGLGSDGAAVVAKVRAVYDRVDEAVAAGAAGVDLPCKAGCDACCHEAVFLCAPEYLVVAEALLRTRTLDERRVVVADMREIARAFEDELELLETILPGLERDEVAYRVRFRCPLLSSEGLCTVYDARELNGRTFGQTWNTKRDAPFGCELTHERLRVLPSGPPSTKMFGAVEAREMLAAEFVGVEMVHVYPWWFARHGDLLLT